MDRVVLFATDFLEINENIEIEFDSSIDKEDNCAGYCVDDEDVIIYVNPKMDTDTIIKTLFHEFVHAKQYINNELCMGVNLKPSTWHGEEYTGDYYEAPWEKEAYELENAMWDIFSQEFLKKTVDIN